MIEVTSPRNKAEAYEPKWKEFALSRVQTYVIVDIAPTNIEMRSVIVRALRKRENDKGWKRSTTKDPKTGLKPLSGSRNPVTCYYKNNNYR